MVVMSEDVYDVALTFIEKSGQVMHSFKYNDLMKSLSGSS